jgi:hypothetical protein
MGFAHGEENPRDSLTALFELTVRNVLTVFRILLVPVRVSAV